MSPVSHRAIRIRPDLPLLGEVDEEARIAEVRPERTTKGMYFADLVARLPPSRVAQIWPLLREPPRHRTYQPFLDYPFADVLRWLHAVARHEHPRVSLLEGMRRLGRDTVKVFTRSPAGRVVTSVPRDVRETLLKMPEMWAVTDPGNRVEAESVPGEDAVRFEIEGFEGWIDCGLLGTLEQIVIGHRCEPTLWLELRSEASARVVVRWAVVR